MNKMCAPKNQSGSVLVISLIVLLVLSLIVLGLNRDVVLQEKMTAAFRESAVVFQAAEAGLSQVERELTTLRDLSRFTNNNGFYLTGNSPDNYFDGSIWESNSTAEIELNYSELTVKYFVEYVGVELNDGSAETPVLSSLYGAPETGTSSAIYRIVVRSKSNNGGSEKILSSYFSAGFSS